MNKIEMLKNLKGKLIVSCQALDDEPLHSSFIMGRMALAAMEGGAAGIRANTVEDIIEIRNMVDLPIIGIIKKDYNDSDIYITPTMSEINKLINSPADIIAMDATMRKRPNNEDLSEMVKKVRESGKLVMADISTYDEGINAEKIGFDIISTTLSGYTPYSPNLDGPDFELIRKLSSNVNIPVISEGRIKTPEDLTECLKDGAFCAIIGGAITRPQLITKDFVAAIN